MKALRFAVAVLLFVCSLPSVVRASCGYAECSVDRTFSERRRQGWVRLGYEYEYSPANVVRNGTRVVSVGAIPGDEDETYTYNRVHRGRVGVGLTDGLSIEASIPWITREHQHLAHDPTGDELQTWHMRGWGDLQVLLDYDVIAPEEAGASRWTAIAGAKFPTGRSRSTDRLGREAEPSVQLGTESYDVLGGAGWSRRLSASRGELPVFASAIYKHNGPGRLGYTVGDAVFVNAGLVYPASSRLGLSLQANLVVRNADDRGQTSQQTERTGGEALYLTPGFECRIVDGLGASFAVQVPVYQRVNVVALTVDYSVLTGLTYRFAYGAAPGPAF